MELQDIAAGYAALAKDTRLRIADVLAAAGRDGLGAGEIARKLGAPPSTLSFHLAEMTDAGLLTAKRRGREVRYALRLAGVRPLLLRLARLAAFDLEDLEARFPAADIEESIMTAAYNVAFICTRNSARSIMAEAILDKVGQGRFRAYSAGTEPAAAPMPEVIDQLKALGHDVSRLRCKHWRELLGPDAPQMDFVLTLCDLDKGEQCPDFGSHPVTAAWPFPDPAKFVGSPAEHTTLLNELYGMIRRRLEAFICLPISSLDHLSLTKRVADLAQGSPYRS